MATNQNQGKQSTNQGKPSRTPLSGSQGAEGEESSNKGGKEFAGGRTREGQEYALRGKGQEYTGEHSESERPETQAGRGGSRGERLRPRRDPSQRVTGKPDVTLRNTSETVILRTCADTLHETFAYCVEQGGKHVEGEHLQCLVEAAELCGLTANFVARGSEFTDDLLQVCAEACKCAEESCEEFGDDERMKACADVCRECYEHCNAQASEKVA